jgi:predicted dehydrogenase
MNELRAAVIGVGRLGAIHARKYAAIPNLKLTHVVDTDAERAAEIAHELGAIALEDHRQLPGAIDLASVAAPGVYHHAIASDLMRAGIDVLVEKPMAATLAQARDLKIIAERGGRVLQIGHLERFNPAIVRLRSILKAPRFVGVVALEALGVAVLTDQIDVANARIRFDNGLIANLNTSRVAPRRERKIRFFQPDAYISVDYEARRIQVYRKTPPAVGSSFPTISAEQIDLEDGDPLMDEITAFVDSVRTRGVPQVTADDGLRVMELSERIRISMEKESTNFPR